MRNRTAYLKARRKIAAKVGFFIHLSVYIVVFLLLLIINIFILTDYFWVKWPLLGWSIGLIIHGLRVFFFRNSISIPAKMIRREMEKEASKNVQNL